MTPTRGYKYIYWDGVNCNADLYEERSKTGQAIHHSELRDNRGLLDKAEIPGIYFCASLDELQVWVKEILDERLADDGIEILEVIPIGATQERVYHSGHKAYVAEAAKVRIMGDEELPEALRQMFRDYFG